MLEQDLYQPVKTWLEADGYTVKGEVRGCDLVAQKDDLPPLIVELKRHFSLDLVLQGVNRKSLGEDIYLAVPAPDSPGKKRNWRNRQRDIVKLCRMLGLGLILVSLDRDTRQVEILLDPAPYTPRQNKRAQNRLLKEFHARKGDPNTGGTTRKTIMTAYRQDALDIAAALAIEPAQKVKDLREKTGIERTGPILQSNHYGWFDRIERGIYSLSDTGHEALAAAREGQGKDNP